MKYRKRTVTIEAYPWNGESIDQPFLDWLGEEGQPKVNLGPSFYEGDEGPPYILEIHTLEGTMSAAPGDMVIRGVKGELYSCDAEIFAMTYDVVEEEE